VAAGGDAEENCHAERVIRAIKGEEVALNERSDLAFAKARAGRFIDDAYRTKRIHPSLGYPTSTELAARRPKRPSRLTLSIDAFASSFTDLTQTFTYQMFADGFTKLASDPVLRRHFTIYHANPAAGAGRSR
jgi:hypothetical protein